MCKSEREKGAREQPPKGEARILGAERCPKSTMAAPPAIAAGLWAEQNISSSAALRLAETASSRRKSLCRPGCAAPHLQFGGFTDEQVTRGAQSTTFFDPALDRVLRQLAARKQAVSVLALGGSITKGRTNCCGTYLPTCHPSSCPVAWPHKLQTWLNTAFPVGSTRQAATHSRRTNS